jgi:hypothetical protein
MRPPAPAITNRMSEFAAAMASSPVAAGIAGRVGHGNARFFTSSGFAGEEKS